MTVELSEEHGSPTITITEDGLQAVHTYRCAWSDRFAWATLFLGSTTTIPDTGLTAKCRQVQIRGFEAQQLGSGESAAYAHALIEVTYDSRANDPGPEDDPNREEQLEAHVEFQTLQYNKYEWTNGKALSEDEAPALQHRSWDYVVTLKGLAAIPAGIDDAIGCVNETEIVATSPFLGGLVFPAETLLFTPPTMIRRYTPDGDVVDVTFRFVYRPNWDRTGETPVARGWNWFWNAEEDAFMQIQSKETEEVFLVYPTADFTSFLGS